MSPYKKIAGHHVAPDGSIYVDTSFVNQVQKLPGVSVEHMGFGEFYVQTPKGRIEVDRMRGKPFEGQSGRSHKFYDDKGGTTAANWVVDQMVDRKLSEPAAAKVATLTERVATRFQASKKTAGSGHDTLMALLGGDDKVGDTYDRLDEDEQSKELFLEVTQKLSRELELSSGAEEALSRLRGIVERGKSWDIALIRNNVFKAAHSLGIKLPSGMF